MESKVGIFIDFMYTRVVFLKRVKVTTLYQNLSYVLLLPNLRLP